MEEGKLDGDVVVFSAAISSCAKAEKWQPALALFAQMLSATIQADVKAYSATISAAEKGGRWECALAMLNDMEHSLLRGDRVIYSAAISACEKKAEWQRAFLLLLGLRVKRLRNDLIACNASISACEKGERWNTACALMDKACCNDLQVDIITFNSLLRALGNAGQWQTSFQVLHDDAQLVEFGLFAFSAAIGACERGFKWRESLRLLVDLSRRSWVGNVMTHNSALFACARAEEWEIALWLFTDLFETGRFDVFSCESALSSCATGDLPLAACELLPEVDRFAFAALHDRQQKGRDSHFTRLHHRSTLFKQGCVLCFHL